MNTSKYRFSLEVQESQSNVCLDVKRGDMKSRTLLITLTDGGFPYHISDECYAVFAATKPDGKKVFNDCVIEDDTIIYELTPQTTAAAGCVECEIRLYGADDKLLTSPGFLIAVHDTTFHDGDVVESETETNTLNRLISDAVEEYMDENDVGGGGKYPNWSKLTWYVMGDSLTEKTHAFTDKHYYDFIQEKTGIKLIVDGISGTGYINTGGGKRTFLERVQDISDEVDVVTIFGSGNDLKSTDLNYAKNAIWKTVKWLAINKPGLRVIIVPPSPWMSKRDESGEIVTDYGKRGELWKTYCDNLQLCALQCDFRYLSDMYECPPFNANFAKHAAKFFTTDPNGIHPNEEGHKALAQYFYNALLQELSLRV